MRIISGKWRGRTLEAPPEKSLEIRPTSDRIRENIFNLLNAKLADGFHELSVADLCAGTGALGFEALSRGAKHVHFVDNSRFACGLIKASAAKLNCTKDITISQTDVLRLPPRASGVNLIFLDPPYADAHEVKIVAGAIAQGWCAPGCIVVIEADRSRTLEIENVAVMDRRDYGKTSLHFFKYN
jgi:16S rRNA (guanine966-N2)-methyltransferase